jgi:transposase InsO family protein
VAGLRPAWRRLRSGSPGCAGSPLDSREQCQPRTWDKYRIVADAVPRAWIALTRYGYLPCCDNAQRESFWSTLKTEFYDLRTFATRAEAIEAVSRWINNVYNTRRRHSALGYTSPLQFEQRYISAAEAA